MRLKLINYLFVAFVCLAYTLVYAQDKNFKEGEFRIDNRVYTVARSNDKTNNLWINENDLYIKKIQQKDSPLVDIDGFKFLSKETIKSAFMKTFGEKRIKTLIDEKPLLVQVYPDYKGRIIAVQFLIESDSKITMVELDEFTVYLKEHVLVGFPAEIQPNSRIPNIMQLIRFKTRLKSN